MSSTSESGHARNVATFERLVQTCQGFGTPYNPSNAGITVNALQTVATTARQAYTTLNTALPAWRVAVSQREDGFATLSQLSIQIMATLVANSFPDSIIEDAKIIHRRITGNRSSRNTQNNLTEPNPPTRTHSTSQRSFDNRLSYFEQLVQMVSGITGYAPNETRLSPTGLAAHLSTLQNLNSSVTSAYITLTQARILRDNTLYDPRTGAVSLAKQVKNYVKAVYGVNSREYQSVAILVFSR
jgi:hypothetical protein